jgi:hypothetical protein
MYKKKEEPSIDSIGSAASKKEVSSNKETSADVLEENYILRLEGLVPQIQAELDKLPAGNIPEKVLQESADIHTFGKRSYLFFMKRSDNPNEKVLLVSAVGLEELNRNVKEIYGKHKLIDIISQPINKRPQSKKTYLAIFVG